MSKIRIPSLATSVTWLEDSIVILSGPTLAASSIIAGVDIVTNNALADRFGWLSFVWAICLLLTLDFQVLALGVKAHRTYTTNKERTEKIAELVLIVLIAAGLAYVSVQMHAIFARVNSAGVSIEVAQQQLGINPIALIYERSALVLVLIFISGWLRPVRTQSEHLHTMQPSTPVQAETQEAVQELVATVKQLTFTITQISRELPAVRIEEQQTLLAPVEPIVDEQSKSIDPLPESMSSEQLILPDRIEALLKVQPHLSVRQVASIIGCSVSTATKWMKRLEVPDK